MRHTATKRCLLGVIIVNLQWVEITRQASKLIDVGSCDGPGNFGELPDFNIFETILYCHRHLVYITPEFSEGALKCHFHQ